MAVLILFLLKKDYIGWLLVRIQRGSQEFKTINFSTVDGEKEDVELEPIRDYMLEWLVPELAAHILHSILSDDFVTPDTRIRAFQILFSHHSKSLNFAGSYHQSYHRVITNHLIKVSNKSPRIEVNNYVSEF